MAGAADTAAAGGRVELFTSLPLLAELTGILGRRKFDRKIAASMLGVDQIVDRYAALTTLVRLVSVARVAPDPDDDVVIGTGLATRADLIVTGDRALLTVPEHEGVRIVAMGAALQLVAAG